MYLVRFERKDDQPNEEYYYYALEDAQKHFELFREDNSGLYQRVVLLIVKGKEIEIDSISFSLGRWARLRLEYLHEYQQDEYAKLEAMLEDDNPYLLKLYFKN